MTGSGSSHTMIPNAMQPACGGSGGLGKRGFAKNARLDQTGGGASPESAMSEPPARKYDSFAAFYPYYLSEHANRTTRRLHFIGTALGLFCLLEGLFTGNPIWVLFALVCGYGFAWFAHLLVEKNRPATFKHPLYSLMGDGRMFWEILTGKIPF